MRTSITLNITTKWHRLEINFDPWENEFLELSLLKEKHLEFRRTCLSGLWLHLVYSNYKKR